MMARIQLTTEDTELFLHNISATLSDQFQRHLFVRVDLHHYCLDLCYDFLPRRPHLLVPTTVDGVSSKHALEHIVFNLC